MFKWLNSNSIHNILNIAGMAVAAIETMAIMTGCRSILDGGLECSQSILPPQVALPVVVGIFVTKLIINLVRDGPDGLLLPQPPVVTVLPVIPVKVVDEKTGKVVK